MTIGDYNTIVVISTTIVSSKSNKDKPIYSYCNIKSHTIDKCYKLHGYLLEYKFKFKFSQSKAQVYQTTFTITKQSSSFDYVLGSLTSTQCHQLITLLSS